MLHRRAAPLGFSLLGLVLLASTVASSPLAPRDPFVPLDQPAADSAICNDGLACVGAREVTVTSIVATPHGRLCILVGGAHAETFIAREGDRLRDGIVASIDIDHAVVVLRVDRPESVKPWEDVPVPLGARR